MASDREMKAIADQAHSHDMRVVAPLNDIDVLRAAVAGVDVLHTPTEPLSDATVQAWAGRAVISTLAGPRFMRRLRAGGATVLGTDMGYTTFPGINPPGIELQGRS